MSYRLEVFTNDTWQRCLTSMKVTRGSGLSRDVRFKIIETELEKFRAKNYGIYIEFEREEDYLMFLLKWG